MSPGRPTEGHGHVTAFDAHVGLGTVRAGDAVEIGFHCTQIADGSRDIAVGIPVDFDIVAGRHGRWEAARVRPGRPGRDGWLPGESEEG